MAAIQEPLSHERQGNKRTARYTGFTEPLSLDRNTTLPHPSADLSENPILEGNAMSLTRTNTNTTSRLRFPGRSRPSAIKSGSFATRNGSKGSDVGLVLDPADMYKGIEYADGSKEDGSAMGQGRDSGVDVGGGRDSIAKGEGASRGMDSEESLVNVRTDVMGKRKALLGRTVEKFKGKKV